MRNLAFVKSAFIRTITLLLFLPLVLNGCGGSGDDSPFTNGLSGPVFNLTAGAAPGALARTDILAQITTTVTRFRITVFDGGNSQVGQQTVARNGRASFPNLPESTYLVRIEGLDGSGNVLGYFDRVIFLNSDLTVLGPGLRLTNTPPAAGIQAAQSGSPYFLFTSTPTTNESGMPFSVTAQVFLGTGAPSTTVTNGVTLASNAVAFAAAPAAQNTDANGVVTFAGLNFPVFTAGTTTLTVDATGVDTADTNSLAITAPTVLSPVCADDFYRTALNTQLAVPVATGVLANDTRNLATLTAQTASANGGTVAVNADGSFTFTPANNFSGRDTFTYTLTNPTGAATCTVSVDVNVFSVNATTGNDTTGDGSSTAPFRTIQQAVTTAPNGAHIWVASGNYTGNVTLKVNQTLTRDPGSMALPVLDSLVKLADGNTMSFMRIENPTNDCIDARAVGGTISNCELIDSGGDGIDLTGATGAWNISNNTITSYSTFGIIAVTGGSQRISLRIRDNILPLTSGAVGIRLQSTGSSRLTAQIVNNDVSSATTVRTIFANSEETADMCLDIENNQANSIELSQANTALFRVEQLILGPPASIPGNTLTGSVMIANNVTSIPNNTCFP